MMDSRQAAFYLHAATLLADVQQAKGWQDKYRLLMLLGKEMPTLDADWRNDATRVEGCESEAWLVSYQQADGRWSFYFDADARIIKGTIALLLSQLQQKTSCEIQQLDIKGLFESLGLAQGLSPSRSNGVHAVIEKIHALMD